jgi:ribonucleotide monophosphatase NagD (HAD superfamily)
MWILKLALERFGETGKTIVIGDRLDTDARMAIEYGLPALIVLTGITRNIPEDMEMRGVRVARNLSSVRVEGGVLCV